MEFSNYFCNLNHPNQVLYTQMCAIAVPQIFGIPVLCVAGIRMRDLHRTDIRHCFTSGASRLQSKKKVLIISIHMISTLPKLT